MWLFVRMSCQHQWMMRSDSRRKLLIYYPFCLMFTPCIKKSKWIFINSDLCIPIECTVIGKYKSNAADFHLDFCVPVFNIDGIVAQNGRNFLLLKTGGIFCFLSFESHREKKYIRISNIIVRCAPIHDHKQSFIVHY